MHGQFNVLLELLDPSREHHCNANDNNCKALLLAVQTGHLNCVRVLLDTSRATCATANAADNTPLMLAVSEGHLHIVQELLDTSRPNHARADARGSKALVYAVYNRQAHILQVLLQQEHHPADPQSEMGNVASQLAVSQGNLECCRVLLGYPNMPPRCIQSSLLGIAAESNNPEVFALLTEAFNRFKSAVTMDPSGWPDAFHHNADVSKHMVSTANPVS